MYICIMTEQEHKQFIDRNKELLELAKPLMEYIQKNYHPHVKIIIQIDTVEVLEGLIMANNTYLCA
jgi:hypothetical protein